jgi:hypothetical protein
MGDPQSGEDRDLARDGEIIAEARRLIESRPGAGRTDEAFLRGALASARLRVEGFDNLPLADQAALVDLAADLGEVNFSSFNGVVGAIESPAWQRRAKVKRAKRADLAPDEQS